MTLHPRLLDIKTPTFQVLLQHDWLMDQNLKFPLLSPPAKKVATADIADGQRIDAWLHPCNVLAVVEATQPFCFWNTNLTRA